MALVPASATSSSSGKEIVLANKKLKTPKEFRTVLEEDEYLGKLGTIIQRDFYPDIPKLRAQKEYLEALDRNDVAKIRQLQIRYSTRRRTDKTSSPTRRSPESFETPAGGERAPSETPSASQNPAEPEPDVTGTDDKKTAVDSSAGVDQYLSKFTSEDNASFEELDEIQRKRERIKHGWMYEAEDLHLRDKVRQTPLALAGADEQLALPEPKPKALDNWSYVARNTVLFHPEDAPLTEEEKLKRDKMAEKQILHKNTRFDRIPFGDDSKSEKISKAAVLHAAVNKGKVDVTGAEEAGFQRAGQFGFVATPSPAPGVNESPLMTWGEIDGTPFRLDAGDMSTSETGPVFKVPEIPMRDRLAQQMTDEISKRYRDKRKKAADKAASYHTNTPRFGSVRSSEKLVSMSPAARRLATTKLGIRIGSDKALNASYTPSPRRQGAARTPEIGRLVRKRPAMSSVAHDAGTSSLTDNLLNLKGKRPKAADFF